MINELFEDIADVSYCGLFIEVILYLLHILYF